MSIPELYTQQTSISALKSVTIGAGAFATIPPFPNDTSKFLRGDESFASPPVTGELLKATVTLTSAQLKALRATPVALIAAAGNGKAISPIVYFAEYRAGATPYTIPAAVNFHIELAANPGDYGFNMTPSGFIDQVSNQVQTFVGGSQAFGPATDVNNTRLQITLTGGIGELTLGDGTLRVTVYHTVVDIDPIIL